MVCGRRGTNMNGAESLLRTLVGSGVEVCFGNPRTSEMHFVAAPDSVEGIGAVWSFRRRDDRGRRWLWPKWRRSPRLRPGLMNGLASLHNARRASTPVINIVARRSSAFPIFAEPIVEFMKGEEQLILVGPSHSGGLQDSLSRPFIRGWDGRPGSSRRRREGARSAVASERIQKARCS
jgi:hypothetical protein